MVNRHQWTNKNWIVKMLMTLRLVVNFSGPLKSFSSTVGFFDKKYKRLLVNSRPGPWIDNAEEN